MTQFNIEPEIVLPGLIHFSFETQYEVSSTMLRLQEFYESPYSSVKDHVFTLEHYMDEYAADTGNFTYTADWSGFNVPGFVVDKFESMFMMDLLQKEHSLFHLIRTILDEHPEWNRYYVVASSKDGGKHDSQLEVLKHEIAHGLWYLDDEYKLAMLGVIHDIKSRYPCIYDALIEKGYCEEVIDDETQAYFATSTMLYLADDAFEDCQVPWELVLTCQRIFDKFYSDLTKEE